MLSRARAPSAQKAGLLRRDLRNFTHFDKHENRPIIIELL